MRAVLALILAGCVAAPALANESGRATGCQYITFERQGFELYGGQRRFKEDQFQVFALRADTALYRDEEGSAPAEQRLEFSERAFVADPGRPGGTRLRLKSPGGQPLGWAARDDVLCRMTPLQDRSTSLLRRMVVRTETEVRGEVRPKNVYPAPAGQCPPAGCMAVSRFQWYFVYLEDGDYVLLAEPAQLNSPQARLLGWLAKGDGIAWNTAAALRPAEELSERDGPNNTRGKFVCAYSARSDVGQREKCRPIIGGRVWYEIEARMPILKDEADVYEVAVSPLARTGGAADLNFSDLKKLDVYFVIDGTNSMQPVIDKIRGTEGSPGLVERLQKRLSQKLKEGTLRLGFRIYRDSIKGSADGITNSDAMPLTAGKCESNGDDFTERLKSVRAGDPPGDTDFPENSYGGLLQASSDITSCPNHLKLVFHIGDHGYDRAAQVAKGFPGVTTDEVVRGFKRGAGGIAIQPIVTVIQTPAQPTARAAEYDRAYQLFTAQAKEVLQGVYQGFQFPASRLNAQSFFHRLPAGEINDAMIDRIMEPIDRLLQPEALARIQTGLAAGQSLEETINQMRNDNRMTIPGIFFDVVVPELCRRLGEQCRQKVLEGVFTAYMPHSGDLETDIILDERQLADWIGMLDTFNDTFISLFRTRSKTRSQLVQLYLEAIHTRLRITPDYSGPNLREFVGMRGGLPYGSSSPLLAYEPAELSDESRVPDCEIAHITDYSDKKRRIMEAARNGTNLIKIEQEQLRADICPNPSRKGAEIPIIKVWQTYPLPPETRPNGERRFTYKFNKSGTIFYWMHNRYLP